MILSPLEADFLKKKEKNQPIKIAPISNKFGVANGKSIPNKKMIIQKLNGQKNIPVLEVILSESVLRRGRFISGNPGGHIGLAVNGKAFSISEGYYKKTSTICAMLPIEDYLYGTYDLKGLSSFGSNLGSCYGRNVWGIRIYKLPQKYKLDRIAKYFLHANERSQSGDQLYAYKKRKQNCATFTARALQAAGFKNYLKGLHLFHFPRDILTDFMKEIVALPPRSCDWEVVLYRQIYTENYGTSFSVPNLEWQRLLTSLPLIRLAFGKLPKLKKHTIREIHVDPDDPFHFAVISPYNKQSWLKKLKDRLFKEKWNKGRPLTQP